MDLLFTGRMISLVEFGNLQKVHRPNDDCEDPYENDDEPTDNTLLEDKCKDFVSLYSTPTNVNDSRLT